MLFGRTSIVVVVVAAVEIIGNVTMPVLKATFARNGEPIQIGAVELKGRGMTRPELLKFDDTESGFTRAGAVMHWADSNIEKSVGPLRFVAFSRERDGRALDVNDFVCGLTRDTLATDAGMSEFLISAYMSDVREPMCQFLAPGKEQLFAMEAKDVHIFLVVRISPRCRARAVGVVDLPRFLELNPTGKVTFADMEYDAAGFLILRGFDWRPVDLASDERCEASIAASQTFGSVTFWTLAFFSAVLLITVRSRSKPISRTDLSIALPIVSPLRAADQNKVIIVESREAVSERMFKWLTSRGVIPLIFDEPSTAAAALAEGTTKRILLCAEPDQAAATVSALRSISSQARVVVVLRVANVDATTASLRAGASEVFDERALDLNRLLRALDLEAD